MLANDMCRGVTILLLVVTSLALNGCLFEPREPELPDVSPVVYLDQNSSLSVWSNLEKSLEATHAPGWENNLLPSDFRYLPDTAAESEFPGVFDTWDRERELTFINNLYNAGVTISAQLRNADFAVPPDSGAEVIWEGVIYDLTVTSTVDGTPSSIRYRGSATIVFRLEANYWYIYEWRDDQGESDPDTGQLLSTMGVLRGAFASN